ncbi:hypothetical protein O3P69_008935 [Scylla paramamosain]|uniref:Metalloendopeptidase n=1 Tax=Scylla paramamosain TaxID=85552 RepID=A0AAW0TSI6_SCYPA
MVLAWCAGTSVRCQTQEIDVRQEDRLRWPGGVVHYSISGNFTLKQDEWIRGAMNMIEQQTCIIFEERPRTSDYQPPKTLYIMTGCGCTCKVGYHRYGSVLRLHQQCFKRIGHVVHELLHALGVRHEHQRFDRNYYIHINQTAIRTPYIRNFFQTQEAHVARVNRLYACSDRYLGDDIPGAVPYMEWQRHVQKLRRLETHSKCRPPSRLVSSLHHSTPQYS